MGLPERGLFAGAMTTKASIIGGHGCMKRIRREERHVFPPGKEEQERKYG